MGGPICKIARKTGDVPLECLFPGGCERNCHEEHQAMKSFSDHHGLLEYEAYDQVHEMDGSFRAARCNRCGSTDVRWRQQGGRWVLFSDTPGVEHACATSAEGFDDVL